MVGKSDAELMDAYNQMIANESKGEETPEEKAAREKAEKEAKDKAGALLNANQPIAAAPPENAEELAPLLKQAIRQSGMFYESHQAEWVEGKRTKFDLLQEPQGRLSSPAAFAAEPTANSATSTAERSASTSSTAGTPGERSLAPRPDTATTTTDTTKSAVSQTIAPQLHSLVQQQLEALATQHFAWQGQVWPGQEMRWEIDENAHAPSPEENDTPERWTTRLRLTLPRLGEIDARIQLHGEQLSLAVSTGDPATRDLMQTSGPLLRNQLDAAGLALISIGVDVIASEENHGET